MKRLVAIASLCAAAASLGRLHAQQPPAPARAPARGAQNPPAPQEKEKEKSLPSVVESVDVSVTSVEVIVTDSKGHRVPNLTVDDFSIQQDGVPQAVTNFYAVSGGKVLLEDGKTIPLNTPEAAAAVPQELKAHYIFFIDNLNIQPQNRNRMFRRLKEFIPQAIGPNAEGMVVTYNRSLKVRRPFTSDANDLVGALENIELDTGGGTTQLGERRDAIRRIDESKNTTEAIGIARTYAQSLRNDIQFTTDSIKSTLDSLAGIPGRKNFLYVSEGLPATAGFEIYEAIRQKYQETGTTLEQMDYDMNSRYVEIIQAANANGVTIYSLDASGLAANDMVSAENASTKNVHLNDFMVRQNMQGPIRMLAEETGGIAAINSNDWKSNLDEIGADFSNFYSLGYRSARGAVDRPHRIEVTVKRKGLTVRTRRGFVEKSIETRTAEAVVASLTYPRADNPLKAGLSVGEPKPYDRENYLLPVRIAAPIAKLGLVPSGDQYEGQFFVYFVVLDASGKQSDLQVQRQEVKIPAKDFTLAQGKDFYYDAKLIVVPGSQKLSVGIRDAISNLTSFIQKSVFVSVLPKEAKPAEPLKPS
ncbi:MAG: VWA domain-containing protein [Acidobacteriota bacterium]